MGKATYGNEERLNIHLGPEEIMQVTLNLYMLRTRQPPSQELLLESSLLRRLERGREIGR